MYVTRHSLLIHLLPCSLSGSIRQRARGRFAPQRMPYSRSAAFAAAADAEDFGSPRAGGPAAGAGAPTLQAYPWPATTAKGRLRAYAVWALPGHPELRGVHLGGLQAWLGLQDLLPGRAYSFQSGTRLRAYPTPALAIIGYLREAEIRGAPDLAIFRWHPAPPL